MNYELLRKLKDASFPQYKSGTERKFYCKHGAYCGSEECYDINDGLVFEPTTDELIEELGTHLGGLHQEYDERIDKNKEKAWRTNTRWSNDPDIEAFGSTPKEALIKLYIALNSVDN